MADIELELGANAKGVNSTVNKTVKTVGASGTRAGRRFSRNLNAATGAGLKRLILAAGAAAAAIGGTLFARASIRAANEQTDAVNRLNSALFQSGEFSKQTSQDLQEFASRLQSVTRFGDEVTISQIALNKSLGLTVDQSKQAVSAAADLAAALGTDLSSANRQLAQTLSGQAGSIGRIIPEVRDLTEEQLRSGAAIDVVASKFAGFAERDVATFSGRVDQLSNDFGDLQETFGFFVTESPAIGQAINALGGGIRQLNQIIVDNADTFRSLVSSVLSGVVSGFTFVSEAIFSTINAFRQLSGFAADLSLQQSLADLREEQRQIVENEGLANAAARDRFEIIQQRIDALQNEGDLEKQQFAERSQALQAIRDQILQTTTDIQTSLGGGDGEESKGIFDNLINVDKLKNDTDGAKEVIKSFQKETLAATAALNAGVSNSLQFLGKSLVQGGGFFEGFTAIALNAIGDLLIAFGSGAIATGVVAEALRSAIGTLSGGQAIVAGLAAITAGGALKAFSSSIGGAAGGDGPTIASSTGTSTGGVVSPTGESAQPLNEEERQATQQVQLVVQGDILDSEDSGRRLLELLNQNFESESSSLVGASFA